MIRWTGRRADEQTGGKFFFSSARLLVCLFLLSACGFHPLYGERSARRVAPQLAQVEVDRISDAAGQQMRNLLLDKLPPPAGQPRYLLKLNLTEGSIGIAISRDATVTRQQMRTTATANLLDRQTGKIVWKQQLFTTSGYNVLGSQFSTLISEEDARTRNLTDLSDRMVGMLALYFSRQAGE